MDDLLDLERSPTAEAAPPADSIADNDLARVLVLARACEGDAHSLAARRGILDASPFGC